MRTTLLLLLLLLCGCQETAKPNGRLVVLLASSAESATSGPIMGPVSDGLRAAGFTTIALDTPCHGAEQVEQNGLECWRRRIDAGERDLFSSFCKRLSAKIDEAGTTDVSVVGLSRGGYVAITCASMDKRIQKLALLMPVTDLTRLREFDGAVVDPAFHLPLLTGRDILIRIGKDDGRVGTDAALRYGQSVGATVNLLDTIGHKIVEDGSTTKWLLEI